MSVVNLESGARTYIASMRVTPNFAPAITAETRVDRKTFAYGAMIDAEQQAMSTLVPKLDALKAEGLLRNYDFATGTGAVILNVEDAQAGAAYEALKGVSELHRLIQNEGVELLDGASEPVPPVPPTKPPVTPKPVMEWNVDKVRAEKAWSVNANGQGVVVGIVDTGANVEHEALKDHYRGTNADGTFDHDYNFFDAIDGKVAAYDDHNHGSHVAGTSVGGTKDRLTGVAPGAKFIAAKVFSASGGGDTAKILKALSWMLAPTKSDGTGADPTKAPDIVSNSWGGSNGASLTYLDAFKAFEAAGIIPIVAAGNAGPSAGTIGAPGSFAQAITIGATDKDDKVARFSSRGPNKINGPDGKPLAKPDVSAPGVDVISAGKTGNSYVKMSGTSMATPAVSGVVAILLSKFPTMTVEQVREVLSKGAVDVDAKGWDFNTGWGRVDAYSALLEAKKMFGSWPTPPAPPEPTPDPTPDPA